MVSNSPSVPFKWVKRARFRDYPPPPPVGAGEPHGPRRRHLRRDRDAAGAAVFPVQVAHRRRGRGDGGVPPVHHLNFPLAVPLEWNILFGYATVFLFLGFPGWHGYGVTDMSPAWLAIVIAAGLVSFPILGNLRPDWCLSCRRSGGTGELGVGGVGVHPGRRRQAERGHPAGRQSGRPAEGAGLRAGDRGGRRRRTIAWRACPARARPVLAAPEAPPDIDTRTVSEGQFVAIR